MDDPTLDNEIMEDVSPIPTSIAPGQSPLQWAAKYEIARARHNLPGDKISLPSSALEQLIAAQDRASGSASSPSSRAWSAYQRYSEPRSARSRELPHPLTFRLSNPSNGRVIYAGVREFSAQEDHICLSGFLLHALGLEEPSASTLTNDVENTNDRRDAILDCSSVNDSDRLRPQTVTVSIASLPKGTYVKLRPMVAGYDTDDWKALLEANLRNSYTTLTKGEVLTIPSASLTRSKGDDFELLIDEIQPEGDAICVIDTDITCDVEALNEEQARETLRQVAEKRFKKPGTSETSSAGGPVSLFKSQEGQVLPGEFVDYELPSWDRSQGLEFRLGVSDKDEHLEMFFSPFDARHRARPRADEHVYADFESRPSKRIKLTPRSEYLRTAEALWVSVHAPTFTNPHTASPHPIKFSIRASPYLRAMPWQGTEPIDVDQSSGLPSLSTMINGINGTTSHGEDQKTSRCSNCHAAVPAQSVVLHENFCRRNNVLCPQGCGQVFQRSSRAFQEHWHCPHDSTYGFKPAEKDRHDFVFHKPHHCPAETCFETSSFGNLPALAHHRTDSCPSKLILCRFCHLTVPQGVPSDDYSSRLTDLTPHELAEGSRTEQCHLCNRFIRLREMDTHQQHHNLDRRTRVAPGVCRNVNCGRTLDSKYASANGTTYVDSGASNDIGLCALCFGPLYSAAYDPDGKQLRRRIERKYLTQMSTGCKNTWCRNEYCRTRREKTGQPLLNIRDTTPLVKPFVEATQSDRSSPLHFCAGEESQKRRTLAEMMAAEGTDSRTPATGHKRYGLPWCIAALETKKGDLDSARSWLGDMAPTIVEEQ